MKQKTHSGAKRRFRVTRNGKVMHVRQGMNHLLEKKTTTHKRRLNSGAELTGGDARQVKRMLGLR